MTQTLAFIGTQEIIIIAVIILLLFGGSRIPHLMRSLGRGAGEFQKGIDEGKKLMEETKRKALEEPDEIEPKKPADTEPRRTEEEDREPSNKD